MIREFIQKELGGISNCTQQVYDQLRKWITQQLIRIDEISKDPGVDFLLSSANLLRERGEENRRKALQQKALMF